MRLLRAGSPKVIGEGHMISRKTRVPTLLILLVTASASGATRMNLPFRFGMSKEAVRKEAACRPYTDVASTDGLECPNFKIDKKRNISLIFTNGGLSKIQLWFTESASRERAVQAVDELIAYLKKSFGPLESVDLPANAEVTRDALLAALDKLPKDQGVKVQLTPRQLPSDAFVFASIIRDPRFGYFVFLYFQPPRQ